MIYTLRYAAPEVQFLPFLLTTSVFSWLAAYWQSPLLTWAAALGMSSAQV